MAAVLWPECRDDYGSEDCFTWDNEEVAKQLRLTERQIHQMAYGFPNDADRAMTLRMLEILDATGEVNWKKAQAT
jgi:hypothetical protein